MKIQLSMLFALSFITINSGEVTKDVGPGYTRYSSDLFVPGTATTPEQRIHADVRFDRHSRDYHGSIRTEEGDLMGGIDDPIEGDEAKQQYRDLKKRYKEQEAAKKQ